MFRARQVMERMTRVDRAVTGVCQGRGNSTGEYLHRAVHVFSPSESSLESLFLRRLSYNQRRSDRTPEPMKTENPCDAAQFE